MGVLTCTINCDSLALIPFCVLTGLASISLPSTRSVIRCVTCKSLLGFKRAKLSHAWFQSNSQHNYLLDLQDEQAYHLINCQALMNSAVHFPSNRMMICLCWLMGVTRIAHLTGLVATFHTAIKHYLQLWHEWFFNRSPMEASQRQN